MQTRSQTKKNANKRPSRQSLSSTKATVNKIKKTLKRMKINDTKQTGTQWFI